MKLSYLCVGIGVVLPSCAYEGGELAYDRATMVQTCVSMASEAVTVRLDKDPFNGVVWVGARDDTSFFVAEEVPPRIRVVTVTGETITSFVTAGSGPGEVRVLQYAAKLADGRIVIRSIEAMTRFEVYNFSGRYQATIETTREIRLRASGPMTMIGTLEGNTLMFQHRETAATSPTLAAGYAATKILRWNLDADTLYQIGPEVIRELGVGGIVPSQQAVPLTSGEMVIVNSHSDTLAWHGENGGKLVAVFDPGGRSITDEWLDSLKSALGPQREAIDRVPLLSEYQRWSLGDALSDDTGALWVREFYPSWIWRYRYEREGKSRWWVITPEGVRQIVDLPMNVDIHGIEDGRIYGVRFDSLEVETISIFDVPPEPVGCENLRAVRNW